MNKKQTRTLLAAAAGVAAAVVLVMELPELIRYLKMTRL